MRALDAAILASPVIGARPRVLSNQQIVLETGFEIPLRVEDSNIEFDLNGGVDDLLDPVFNADGEPLIKILVTKTPTRSYVGVSFSHLLGDGASYSYFLNLLTDFYATQTPPARPISNRRDLLQNLADSSPTSSLRKNLYEATGYVTPRPPNPDQVSVETLHFSNEEVEDLRKTFLATEKISVNNILMAVIAKKFHATVPLHNGKFLVRCPVDYRKILGLPAGYFGNAVRDAVAVFEPAEIERASIEDVAFKIQDAIQQVDKANVVESLRHLDSFRQANGIQIFEDVGCPGLLVSNLSKMPFQNIVFDLGAPIGFHHASLNPRLALILASPVGFKIPYKRPVTAAKSKTEPVRAGLRLPFNAIC